RSHGWPSRVLRPRRRTAGASANPPAAFARRPIVFAGDAGRCEPRRSARRTTAAATSRLSLPPDQAAAAPALALAHGPRRPRAPAPGPRRARRHGLAGGAPGTGGAGGGPRRVAVG